MTMEEEDEGGRGTAITPPSRFSDVLAAVQGTGDGKGVVLVLDGGVSTHLEESERRRRRRAETRGCCGRRGQLAAAEGAPEPDSEPAPDVGPREEAAPDGTTGADMDSGPPVFEPRELWSSSLLLTEEGRDAVKRGHLDWLEAGADVLSTVTYQLHGEPRLWPKELQQLDGTTDDPSSAPALGVKALWNDGVRLAREAVAEYRRKATPKRKERPLFVVASLGCYGAALANGAEYTGDYGDITETDLVVFHARKLDFALQAQPDAVAWETIPSLAECRALVNLLRERFCDAELESKEHPPVVAWVSLACRDGDCLNDGSPVEKALETLYFVPATVLPAVGFNCCDVRNLPSLLERLLQHSIAAPGSRRRRAIALYPNSGEAWDAAAACWVPGATAADGEVDADGPVVGTLGRCVDLVRSFEREHCLPSVAIVVGGCCRTSVEEVAALRRRADGGQRTPRKGKAC